MSTAKKRPYDSSSRAENAEATKAAILAAANALFSNRGIDKVKIADIADRAGVAGSTVYSVFKSKEGILRALMRESLFGPQFRQAQSLLAGVTDPVSQVALTASVARAIYESESSDLGLLRGSSGFSPSLRKIEEEFESLRYAMQEERLTKLRDSGRLRQNLTIDESRRIMWMFTSRDVYRMLVREGGWTPDRYQDWLSQTLLEALVNPTQ
jgi:AcrR family transcriptional regulator